jgi:hypothetical protein
MNTNNICFVSVVFKDRRYFRQQDRLLNSISAIYPNDESHSYLFFTDSYPPGSRPHYDSLYGFKVHAVKAALKEGYKKIIWLDTACLLVDKVDYYFDIIKDYGIIAARDENPLSKSISDKALEYFGNPDIKGMHLVGGSLYVFDFNLPLCIKIFDQWAQAEVEGIFGSQFESASGQINKHRHDEAILAYLLYANGSKPVPYDQCRYNNGEGSIVIKKHFK